MKRRLGIVLLICTCIILSACRSENNKEQTNSCINSSLPEIIHTNTSNDGFYNINLLVNDKYSLLFASKEAAQSGLAMRDFYVKNINSGEILFEYSNENGFYINEYQVVSDNIYWVFTDENGSSIQSYNIISKELDVIFEEDISLKEYILSSDNRFVSWTNVTSGELSVNVIDTLDNSCKTLSNSILGNVYSKAYVNDGILPYVEDIDGQHVIRCWDLANKPSRIINIDNNIEVARLQANKDWIIFTDGYDITADLYCYNMNDNKLSKLDLIKSGESIFSINLYNNLLVLNAHKNTNGRIFVVDLQNMKSIDIYSEYVAWPYVSSDGIYTVKCPFRNEFISFDLRLISI